jgi:hypothetical protein
LAAHGKIHIYPEAVQIEEAQGMKAMQV